MESSPKNNNGPPANPVTGKTKNNNGKRTEENEFKDWRLDSLCRPAYVHATCRRFGDSLRHYLCLETQSLKIIKTPNHDD